MSVREANVPGWRRYAHGLAVLAGAVLLALCCFLVLPLLKAITSTPQGDVELREAQTAELPPPPPPIEEEKEEQKPEEPPPPQVDEAPQPLDLSQLELALNPGMGGAGFGADFGIKIQALTGGGRGDDDMFSLADLDQKPRPVYQQQPRVTAQMKKRMPATVTVLFTVNENGRVEDPLVQNSTDPSFDASALAAIKQWKFEPGKRGGQPVRFRMRQPMTFK